MRKAAEENDTRGGSACCPAGNSDGCGRQACGANDSGRTEVAVGGWSADGGGTRVSEGQLLEDADEGGGRRKPLEAGCTLQAVGDGVLLLAHGTRLEAYVPQRVPPPAAAAAEDACA